MGWRSKNEHGRARSDDIENVLGRSAVVHGDLKAEGAFRVDGTVDGCIESKGAVVIGESGLVKGDIRASEVVVAGRVYGSVFSSGHLDIVRTGRIEGDIEAQSVRVETGGVFRGMSRMGKPDGPDREAGAPTGGPGRLTSVS